MIEVADRRIHDWTIAKGIDLYRVEHVVPFVETDFSLTVWLFYRTSVQVDTYRRDGITAAVQQEYLRVLSELGYPGQWLGLVTFRVDSDENVRANYEGNYFYRLR